MTNPQGRLSIRIPSDWTLPGYSLGQRTKQGLIIGIQYYPSGTFLAQEEGQEWRYSLLLTSNIQDLDYKKESEIEPLSTQELRSSILADIELYQSKIAALTEQLNEVEQA
ncbi:MAG: hypothetical protein V7K47_18130 [Nostoc sp.]